MCKIAYFATEQTVFMMYQLAYRPRKCFKCVSETNWNKRYIYQHSFVTESLRMGEIVDNKGGTHKRQVEKGQIRLDRQEEKNGIKERKRGRRDNNLRC